MMVDLKVLVRSFNCESRACYVGNPRGFFFSSSRKRIFIRESFTKVSRKLDIMNHYISLYTLQLVKGRPGARGPAGEWYTTFTFPLIGSSQASEGEASPQLNTCRSYCLTVLSEVSRNKLQMQQPSFQKWGFARAKHQGPWCLLFLWCAVCWWLGSAHRGIFAKVPRKFCEGLGDSQSASWREWPSKPCNKNA